MSKATLYYVHDPMCSWCWGFRPVWTQVQQSLSNTALTEELNIRYVLGGLTPDTDQAMPADMQRTITVTWRQIQKEIPGTEFNFDFWTDCQPRRSTYPSCRAVIAARLQAPAKAFDMLSAIQQAYYLQAKNPSDDEVLIQLSRELGLNVSQFESDLHSAQCKQLLQQEMHLARRLDASSFPSLVLQRNDSNTMIYIDYNNSELIVSSILEKLSATSKSSTD